MKVISRFLMAYLLVLGLAVSHSSMAQTVSATRTTTIDVNFPEILVMYTYSNITLDLDATFFAGQLGLGTTIACDAGASCVDATTTTITVDALTEDVDIAGQAAVPADGALTDVSINLTNAIAARSLGMTDANYTVNVVDQANSTVINLDGTPDPMPNSGLQLSTTNLPIILDVSEITGPLDTDSEDFEITVEGT